MKRPKRSCWNCEWLEPRLVGQGTLATYCLCMHDRLSARWCKDWKRIKRSPSNAGAVPRRGSDVGTSPLLAVFESGDK